MRRSLRKPRAPHRADLRGGRFLGIPVAVLDSEAYRLLSPIAKVTLFCIAKRFLGHNNGKLGISYREIARELNRKNQAPIGPAIAQLMQHGLVALETEGQWRPRLAREYRLTFVSSGPEHKPVPATNEYLNWKPEASGDKKNSPTRTVAGKLICATPAVARARKPALTLVAA